MKIAVTGVTGQLGSAVLKELDKHKFETFSLDRSRLDFQHIRSIEESLSGFEPDIIVNCAAFTEVDSSENEIAKVFAVNATGATELAKYCSQKEIRLIQISTDSIFSSSSPIFFKPMDSPSPINMYGKSKLQGEIGVLQQHPNGATIIRTAWLFGHSTNKFVQAIIRQGVEGKSFRVVDDQFGQPTFTNSLAEFIVFLITTDYVDGIYHFASSDYVSRHEYAKSILDYSQLDSTLVIPCPTVRLDGVAERPKYSLLDVSEASVSGYPGITMWKQELAKYFDLNKGV